MPYDIEESLEKNGNWLVFCGDYLKGCYPSREAAQAACDALNLDCLISKGNE
jgi:hypothetical protein